MASSVKTAVFLLNMGGPDSLDAIRPFLENLFSDPEILKFPLSSILQKPLAKMIASRRSEKVKSHYEAMGGKSPLVETTLAQAEKLAERLGDGFSVHVAMRYWNPRADEAVAEAAKLNPERIIVLPLYPHYSRATTGTSITDLKVSLDRGGLGHLPIEIVNSWQDFNPYIEAIVTSIRETIAVTDKTTLLFSAHGLPVSLIEKGDPYLDHIKATVAAVMERFTGVDHRLAFQSRAGPVKWLEPSVEQMLETLAKEGVEDVTVVAISFVSDHIETLIEIDEQFREFAEKLGIPRFRRAPALNVRPDFITALEKLVVETLNK